MGSWAHVPACLCGTTCHTTAINGSPCLPVPYLLQAGMPELSRLVSSAWRELAEEEKEPFNLQAKVCVGGWAEDGARLVGRWRLLQEPYKKNACAGCGS